MHDRVGAISGGYSPSIVDDGPPVIALDNLTNGIDNMVGVVERYRGTEEPEWQAMMAAGDACVSDAVARLARRPNTSWIMCASGVEQLTTLHGEQTAAKAPTSHRHRDRGSAKDVLKNSGSTTAST